MTELPPRISAKGPNEIRKREVSFDKWAKWAIRQNMHALAQPVSSITATSTADQIAQSKEMDTPVKFRGGKRLGSKSIKIRGGKRLGCWSSVDATIAVDTHAKACIAELPPRISAKGPMEIRKREVSFDKWAKWAIRQVMHALAQPVSSITATSTSDQIAQSKEMDTPVKFRGGKRLGSKTIKSRRFRKKASWLSRISKRLNLFEGQETCDTWPFHDLPSIR